MFTPSELLAIRAAIEAAPDAPPSIAAKITAVFGHPTPYYTTEKTPMTHCLDCIRGDIATANRAADKRAILLDQNAPAAHIKHAEDIRRLSFVHAAIVAMDLSAILLKRGMESTRTSMIHYVRRA